MAVIRVDFDELMQFGHTYTVMSDSLTVHARALDFDSSRFDQMVHAFGIDLVTASDHFRGKGVALSAADAQARAGRVAHYLDQVGTTLYRHAGTVGYQDSHFDWLGIVKASFHPPVIDGLAFLGELVFTELVGLASVQGAFASVFGIGGALVPGVALVVLGGVVFFAKTYDLIFYNGGFWEQLADGFGALSGFITLGLGVALLAGMATLGSPVVLALGAVAAVAGAASFIIDHRRAIQEALTSSFDRSTIVLNDTTEQTSRSVNTMWRGIIEMGPLDAAELGIDVHGAVGDVGFVTRFGGVPLSDFGSLQRFAGTNFGPMSVLSAGVSALQIPSTMGEIGDSWQGNDPFGVVRDTAELVEQGASVVTPFFPAVGVTVKLGAMSFGTGMDIGDAIDEATGFSSFAADIIYDSPLGRLFD